MYIKHTQGEFILSHLSHVIVIVLIFITDGCADAAGEAGGSDLKPPALSAARQTGRTADSSVNAGTSWNGYAGR